MCVYVCIYLFFSGGRDESTYALQMMLYMLTHDPMVLYAPNGTEADKVVQKVKKNFFKKISYSSVLNTTFLGRRFNVYEMHVVCLTFY